MMMLSCSSLIVCASFREADSRISVRNRATEIASLLSDLDKIRAERRKAKANKNKYVGTGYDGMGGGGRYDGFGNDRMYGSSGGGYSGNTGELAVTPS